MHKENGYATENPIMQKLQNDHFIWIWYPDNALGLWKTW